MIVEGAAQCATTVLHLSESGKFSVPTVVAHPVKLSPRKFLEQRSGRKYTSIVTVLSGARVPALQSHAKRINAPSSAILVVISAMREALQPTGNAELFAVLVMTEAETEIEALAFPSGPHDLSPANVSVQVGGAPRDCPQRKCTSWSTGRRYLESARRSDCTETILATNDGTMYEGLVTNLFVVMNDNSILTAPDDVVLNGVMRDVVLKVCQKRDITVVRQCPMMKDCARFGAAFLTNVNHILQPVHCFWWNDMCFNVSSERKYDVLVKGIRQDVWNCLVGEAADLHASTVTET